MELTPRQKARLRRIPGVDAVLEAARTHPALTDIPRSVLTRSAREVMAGLREAILGDGGMPSESELTLDSVLDRVRERARRDMSPNLKPVVNATGVVVHTNLGRSRLPAEAIRRVAEVAGRYSNLEFDLPAGRRGQRYSAVDGLLREITGAEAALVVNNNAGAVLLCLETLARSEQVVVSRGELVEIGGAFRIPDVMARSGAILIEVGTTNRTHPRDYAEAINNETALLLKVHKSNYSVVGFTAEVSLADLVALGAKHGVPVMEDLGSGNFIDLTRYGLTAEPTVQASVAAGADLVTFSGDKLLGGPQAGIIVGRRELVDRLKKNPITRALRIDKMTLAALESVLRLYRDPETAVRTIPTLRAMTRTYSDTALRAAEIEAALTAIGDPRLETDGIDLSSRVGGGALPLLTLPSRCVGLRVDGFSPNAIEERLRTGEPPVIGRIEADQFVLDPRTVAEDEVPLIASAVTALFDEVRP